MAPGLPIVGFLNGTDNSGVLQYEISNPDTVGHILWQNYKVFYFKASDRTLRLVTVPLTPNVSSVQPVPYRIESFDGNPGDPIIAHNVDQFAVTTPDSTDPHAIDPSSPCENPVTLKIVSTQYPAGDIHYPGYTLTLETSVVMYDSTGNGGGARLNPAFFLP